MILTKIGRKIARLAQAIENPKLFSLRRRGIPLDEFIMLKQPWLMQANIRTVFDVGANIGQFAELIHEVLPNAMIYSFEPLEDCYEELKKKMQKIENFQAFNIALGDTNGELEFHKNDYSPSSSALPMGDLHKRNYPFTANEQLIKVKSARLDDITKELSVEPNLLIKIDVQGFEDRVIAGGKDTVKQTKVLILETSFQPLYVGQRIFTEIYDSLKEDFLYMGALARTASSINGSILQEDSIFLRKTDSVSC